MNFYRRFVGIVYVNCQAINTSYLSYEKRSKIIVDLRVEQPFAPFLR